MTSPTGTALSPGDGSLQKRLIVVKIETSEPGLYGLGCATFTQRANAVRVIIDEFLKPLLVGRDAHRIEDIWQLVHHNAYWRSGPAENNAMSGVDQALWDIKGKVAGLPVYQLLGGKCREAAAVYRHAGGATPQAVEDDLRRYMEAGYRYVRVQMGGYGGNASLPTPPAGAVAGDYFDPHGYALGAVEMFAHLRDKVGFGIELLHDVHERLVPIEGVRLAKELEPYRLFFLEDLLPPEHVEWFAMVRQVCTTPLAMGELFNNPQEWKMLITNRLIDFIRCHISTIGGLTPARKLAVFCEQFGVRTAWHGPGDVSPVGHAVNVHLDVASPNFGIQEWAGFSDLEQEIFPGCPELRDGYAYPNDKPGLGIDIDEKLAARFPCPDGVLGWTQTRYPDGTLFSP
ncbi:MAG: starvation-sensing protein RspA [Armatimonadetes bacterium]|nr:starvation-sensing protein RspA [Armatimonadota bacterium]